MMTALFGFFNSLFGTATERFGMRRPPGLNLKKKLHFKYVLPVWKIESFDSLPTKRNEIPTQHENWSIYRHGQGLGAFRATCWLIH